MVVGGKGEREEEEEEERGWWHSKGNADVWRGARFFREWESAPRWSTLHTTIMIDDDGDGMK